MPFTVELKNANKIIMFAVACTTHTGLAEWGSMFFLGERVTFIIIYDTSWYNPSDVHIACIKHALYLHGEGIWRVFPYRTICLEPSFMPPPGDLWAQCLASLGISVQRVQSAANLLRATCFMHRSVYPRQQLDPNDLVSWRPCTPSSHCTCRGPWPSLNIARNWVSVWFEKCQRAMTSTPAFLGASFC